MVANIVYSGITDDVFGDAFYNSDLASLTSTQIIVVEQDTGFRTTLAGRNFAARSNDEDPTGTLNDVHIRDASNNSVLSISGVNWDLTQFIEAITEQFSGEDGDQLSALLNQQPVNFNASGSNIGADIFMNGVSQPVTLLGSAYRDSLSGGDGNDTINPGTTQEYDGDVIFGSPGNDSINLANMGPNRWFELTYEEFFDGPVTVNVNGNAETMTVNKSGADTDTVLNVGNVLEYGLTTYGTEFGDTFNIIAGTDQWHSAKGLAGDDTYNITLNGTFSLQYNDGWVEGPNTGITANLATGVVSNDGFGDSDRINILGGTGTFELRGTNYNDNITGSARDERFRLQGGNDTLDAGDGYDTLRYDRNEVGQLDVDLSIGIATGTWNGDTFNHRISGIEEVRGSYGNDMVVGDAGDNRLHGYDGDDSLYGGDGLDRLYGGNGNDYLNPGNNTDYDYVDPGAGDDYVDASDMETGFLEVGHYDLRNIATQVITLDTREDDSTATIEKGGNGTTTIGDVEDALTADGLFLYASELDDTFNITFDGYGWLGLRGGRGNDTYNLAAAEDGQDAIIRLDFNKDSGNNDVATQGLNIDLGTGVVSNDGFGGRDQINISTDLRLEVRGTNNADVMMGSHRDERFIGQAGNDTIDGKGGYDMIRFDRSGTTSGVDIDLGAGTATGTYEGEAFNYTLANIEEVRGSELADQISGSTGAEVLIGYGGNDVIFGDGAAAAYYGSDIANQVYRLYQATLDRAPDTTGHSNWTSRIATGERSLLEVAEGFVRSPEFQQTYAGADDVEFVTLLYRNVLDTTPDANGLARWTGELANGASRAEIVLGFSQSPQFNAETSTAATQFAQNSLSSSWSDDVFRLYQATLNRAPDVTGQTNWSERLANGERSLLEVAEGFVGSPEFQQTYAGADDVQFVTLLYQNVLGRDPDANGLARWTGELSDGASRAEVVLGFSQSPQFRVETLEDLKGWMRDQGVQDAIEAGAGVNTVAGGQFTDLFVFDTDNSGSTTVLDLEAWDYIYMDGFGYDSASAALGRMTQQGSDVHFGDQGVQITFEDTTLAQITEDMFWI